MIGWHADIFPVQTELGEDVRGFALFRSVLGTEQLRLNIKIFKMTRRVWPPLLEGK